jgi:hypothetical protein
VYTRARAGPPAHTLPDRLFFSCRGPPARGQSPPSPLPPPPPAARGTCGVRTGPAAFLLRTVSTPTAGRGERSTRHRRLRQPTEKKSAPAPPSAGQPRPFRDPLPLALRALCMLRYEVGRYDFTCSVEVRPPTVFFQHGVLRLSPSLHPSRASRQPTKKPLTFFSPFFRAQTPRLPSTTRPSTASHPALTACKSCGPGPGATGWPVGRWPWSMVSPFFW